jgi:hypothetical protein
MCHNNNKALLVDGDKMLIRGSPKQHVQRSGRRDPLPRHSELSIQYTPRRESRWRERAPVPFCENEDNFFGASIAHLLRGESPQSPLSLVSLRPNQNDGDVRAVPPALDRPPLPHLLHCLVPVVSDIKTQHKRTGTRVRSFSEVVILPVRSNICDGKRIRRPALIVIVKLNKGIPCHPRDIRKRLYVPRKQGWLVGRSGQVNMGPNLIKYPMKIPMDHVSFSTPSPS